MRIILKIFWIFPIKKNRVILLNECNFKYGDSPACVSEYLIKKYDEILEIIFPLGNMNDRPNGKKNLIFVKFGSIQYYYYALTAKVFLTNDGGISYLPLRKKQYVINTWHGGGAYKAVAASLNNNLIYEKDMKLAERNTDLFVSSGKRFSEVMSEALFMPEHKFLKVGLPRNDMLIHPDPNRIREIRDKLNIRTDEKLILYAPTFRKRNNASLGENIDFECSLDADVISEAAEKRFSGKWIFGFRAHPSIKNKSYAPLGKYTDMSGYHDMQELLLIADILITDYSSSLWDFMLTQKPAFIYAEDLYEYCKHTAFYTPIDLWPFSKATECSELKDNIINFDKDDYLKKCKYHYNDLGGCETGYATELVGDIIISKCCI